MPELAHAPTPNAAFSRARRGRQKSGKVRAKKRNGAHARARGRGRLARGRAPYRHTKNSLGRAVAAAAPPEPPSLVTCNASPTTALRRPIVCYNCRHDPRCRLPPQPPPLIVAPPPQRLAAAHRPLAVEASLPLADHRWRPSIPDRRWPAPRADHPTRQKRRPWWTCTAEGESNATFRGRSSAHDVNSTGRRQHKGEGCRHRLGRATTPSKSRAGIDHT